MPQIDVGQAEHGGHGGADGRNFHTIVRSIRLNPTSDFSFIGNDFADVSFDGVLETPTGYDSPMESIWLS